MFHCYISSDQKPRQAISAIQKSLRCFGKSHCHRIHAITQTGWTRAIVEQVPQVRVTQPARNSCSHHEQGVVRGFQDIVFRDGRPKARPARAGFEFGLGIKQRGIATNTAENAFLMIAGIFMGVGTLGLGEARLLRSNPV
jgi:hypothetical protein